MRLWGATASHVGNVREVNQDRVYFRGSVAALADGMGGHQGGERAAELAIGEFRIVRAQLSQEELVDVVEEANRQVHQQAADPNLRGMGTTMVALGLHQDDSITVTNVGDSRAYWLRGDFLAQVTEDHSFVEDLVRQGRLSPEEATVHPQRNILTRALGIADEVLVDRFDLEPKVGDRFLLCSDGLFNEVPLDEITQVLLDNPEPGVAAEALVAAALDTPCRDNVTVAVVNVVEDDHPAVVDQTDMGIDLTPPARTTDQYPIVASDVGHITDRPPSQVSENGHGHPESGSRQGHQGHQGRHGRPPTEEFDLRAADADRFDDYADEPDIAGGATTTYEIGHMVERQAPSIVDADRSDRYPSNGSRRRDRGRTLRRVLTVGAIVAVAAFGYVGGQTYNNSFHHVDVVDGELVIFNGRQDELVFFGRSVEDETGRLYDDLTEASQATVDGWGNFDSLNEALLGVDSLDDDTPDNTIESEEDGESSDGVTGG